MLKKTLNGAWELRNEHLAVKGESGCNMLAGAKNKNWIDATVPGEVHLDLMAAGKMDEPLVADNAQKCRWPEHQSWWYRTTIEVDEEFTKQEQQELVFHGIDYYGQVFLNGQLIGECENAFVPAIFDITHKVKPGENQLYVRVTVGTELAEEQSMSERVEGWVYGSRGFKGIVELRKPQFSYGWDWVEGLPNIGIWRDVELCGYSGLRLHDFIADTKLDGDACTLDLQVDIENIHPWSDRNGELEIALTAPDGTDVSLSDTFVATVGIHRSKLSIDVDKPQLWWPNGMGDQPLYELKMTVKHEGTVVDEWTRMIGLRTVEIDRSPLPVGNRFVIKVNGEEVFCRGGNWIPADAIIGRVDRGRYETLITAAKTANMNMLRIWGGGIYESDTFYELCNEMGILVWQDFMFACRPYPDDTLAFRDKVRNEAEAAVRRLRHNPSIALWCANNETTWAFHEWWNKEKDFPAEGLEISGHWLYSRVLPQVCLDLDPTRPYWPGSPAGGEHPNSELEGDCHWWHKGTMNQDITRRYRHEVYDECKARFASEYGIIGPCHLDSMRAFLGTDEIELGTLPFQIHTNLFEKETTPAAITHHYADAEDISIEEYVRYGQMFQAIMYGRTIESMRFRKHDPQDDCAGALIWMFNDCWGETGWTPIDYYFRRKASYYWIKNACANVRAIVRQRDEQLVTRVVNDSRADVALTVSCGWMRVDGGDKKVESKAITVPANDMVEIKRDTIPADADMAHADWIYVAYVEGEGVDTIPFVWTLQPHRQLNLVKQPEIAVKVNGKQIELVSDVYCHGVCHPDEGQILFSDNYFDLIPGIPKTIECLVDEMPELQFEAVATK